MTAPEQGTDKVRDAFMLAPTQAQGARVLNVNAKWLRDLSRNKLGVYVSRGHAYDDKVKAALYDLATARIKARTVNAPKQEGE